jgi:hypothetical protein
MAAFQETMRGTLVDTAGVEHPVAFEVHAVGTGGGHHTLSGVIALPPWTDEASTEGTLVMSLRPRAIAYELAFTADDGQRLRLSAKKTPSLLSPLRSMTYMPAEILAEDGRVLASGSMTFDLRDLLGFIASWLPRRSLALRRLEARQRLAERRAFTRGVLVP